MRRRRRRNLPASVILLLVMCLVIGAAASVVCLLLRPERLGWLFLPVVFLFFAIPLGILYQLLRQKELHRLRALLGDELFFETFPKERRKEEKRKK